MIGESNITTGSEILTRMFTTGPGLMVKSREQALGESQESIDGETHALWNPENKVMHCKQGASTGYSETKKRPLQEKVRVRE